MMTSSNGNIFCVTGPLWGKSTGHRWIPITKVSDAVLWCFPLSAHEQTIGQAVEMPMIWDAITLVMASLQCDQYTLCSIILSWKQFNYKPSIVFLHRGTIMRKGISQIINLLRPRQNGRLLADNIFRAIFLFENVCMLFIFPNGAIQIVIQIMAWRRAGDKTLSEPMVV